MKLADLSTGPDWVVYVGFIIFAVLSIVLISGHGSWLISQNILSSHEKHLPLQGAGFPSEVGKPFRTAVL